MPRLSQPSGLCLTVLGFDDLLDGQDSPQEVILQEESDEDDGNEEQGFSGGKQVERQYGETRGRFHCSLRVVGQNSR